MKVDNIWFILIVIIIIILLLMNLFDVKIDFFESQSSNEEILKDDVEIKHNQTIKDFPKTNKQKYENALKVKLNTNIKDNDINEEDEVKENDGYNLIKTKHYLKKYGTEEEDRKVKERYINQNKEYQKAFKGKNELDYEGNVITDENIYQYNDFSYINANQLFIPTDYKTTEEDYGRNYIPPELWYKNNQRLNLPVCVPSNSRCTIKETMTSGYPLDTVEWHSSRRITNPDGINIKYVKEKLNSGL